MMNISLTRTQLKTGARPGLRKAPDSQISSASPVVRTQQGGGATNKHEKILKRGSLLFIEGEKGDNMYIIKSGKVKILKQEGSKTIELAVLGAGSVLGEMSLLIDMPRSATAQVIEDLTALSIDKAILQNTYTKIPPWLVSVIKVVVKRLSDTLKKNSDNLISDNIGGLVNLIVLLINDKPANKTGSISLSVQQLKEEALYTIGLTGSDVDKIITELILKELMVIGKTKTGKELLLITKKDILLLYFEYLFAHFNGKTVPGENISDSAMKFIKLLLSIGSDKCKKEKDGSIVVSKPALEVTMEKAGLGRFLDMDILDELKGQNLIKVNTNTTSTSHASHKQITVQFFTEKLRKALTIKEWIQTFAYED